MKNLKYFFALFTLSFLLFACEDDNEVCTEQVYYQDADGDGEGNVFRFVTSCNALDGFVLNSLDPNDSNDAITSASIWNGPSITFSKADNADWTLPANQDQITPNVAITRADNQGLFNIVSEMSFDSDGSPQGTLWAEGTLADISGLEFERWVRAVDWNPPGSVGRTFVVFLTAE